MASELIKNKALLERLKEPDIPVVNFDLTKSALDYNIESIEEDILPKEKPQELFDERDRLRIESLEQSLQETKPFLMQESVDFIEREEFADGPKTAAKKSLLKFLNPDYLKAKGPERSALLSQQRDPLGRIKKGTSAVLKDVDQTENFLKKFYEYSDKFFGGNRSRALASIIPNYDPANKSILTNMRLRVGLPSDEGSLAQRTKIKGLKEGLTFSEFRTKIAKEPDFLKKVTKGANVNKFYNTRDLFNLLGITTERGNPKAIEYFTGELKRAGVESRPNPAGGLGKQYKLKNVINFFKEKPKTMLGKTSAERNLERFKALKELDKGLVDFNREVIKNVRETAVAEDVYIPKNILGASAGDHIGHPVSVKVTTKPEFKSLLKDSNVNKMNSLVFQDAVVNVEALNKKTGYDTKFNTYFKQLNKFLNKPITEKNRTELIKIKNDMDNHYVKAVNTVNKLAEENEFFKGQQKRIPKVTINIPEVGSKFKSSDLFADMSTVDSEYRYGKVQDINPDAKFFKDLSDDQKQIFKQNIYNQYSDNLNSFYKAAKIPVKDVEEFSEFIEAGGVKETVGTKDVIPIEELGKKKLTALQKMMQTQNVGIDPVLALRAGKEEFLDPALKTGGKFLRGAGTAADFAISAGKGAVGLGIGALLEADPIITGMSEGKTFGQTARDTFIGSAIDAIPGVDFGNLGTDVLKFAETDEQRNVLQGLLDYQNEYDQFLKEYKAFKGYERLNQVELEELGLNASDMVDLEARLTKTFMNLTERAPEVYNKKTREVAKELARKTAMQRKENLESGFQGFFFGDRPAKDPDFVDKKTDQIYNALIGLPDATDRYQDLYKSLPTPELSPEELDEIYEMGGITGAAEGGRIGFAEGPMDPKRRLFLKLMGGIASLPILGKFIGKSDVVKPIVKVAGSSTEMPDWFPSLINKVMFSGKGKKIDADITLYETNELPNIKIYRQDDGKVSIVGKNEYGKNYEIEYEPPGYELIDETTGKAVKKKGEFIAQEEVPVNVDPDGNASFDVEVLDDLDQILGPDTRLMEEYATGKVTKTVKDFTGDSGMKRGEYNVGAAEARFEAAEEAAAALDEID